MTEPRAAQDLLTINEVAEILQVHPQTVYTYVRRGLLPAQRLGTTPKARIRILYSDLTDAITKAQTR